MNRDTPTKNVVWVVDDNPESRDMHKRMLDPRYSVDTFESGLAAVIAYRERMPNALPDVVLLDLNMSELRGGSILTLIRCLNPSQSALFINAYEEGLDLSRLGARPAVRPYGSQDLDALIKEQIYRT